MAKEERMLTLTIDGVQVSVPSGTTILGAAAKAGIKIPTLCNNQRLMPYGACRICIVQQKGRKNLIPSCFTPARNAMEILTRTPEVVKARRTQLQLILISHPLECPVCDAGGECQLQDLVYEYGVADNPFAGQKADLPVDHVSPFVERNLNRCIVCGMCVRICDEVVGANEISFVNRGIKTKIGTDFERPMNCEFCGQCVSVCPVGALNDRIFLHKARPWDIEETVTTCGYCGVGCTIVPGVKNDRILRVRGDEDLGVNQGNLCVKGRFGWEYVHSPGRLKTPMIRKNGSFAEASWEEAVGLAARRFKEIKAQTGAGSLAGLASSRLTNEELYLFQKLLRGVLGTPHVDHSGGYSYSAHLAIRDSLGYAASTNSIREIRNAEVIIALRSDLSETHPVIKSEVVLAVKRRKSKLIVVNSRNIYLNKFSALGLRVKPGTEVALVNGMARVILREGLADEEFIRTRTEGVEALRTAVEPFSPEKVEAETGVAAAKMEEAARLYGRAKKAAILISTGLNSGRQDPALARAATNLALLTGKLGKESCGIFVLGEKNNAQGALDMGTAPGFLPGYADIGDPAERSRFEKAWGLPLPEGRALGAMAILEAIEAGKIKALYLAGENPLATYSDPGRIKKAFSSLDLLVVQDCFLTETASMAHVVLPAAAFAEKEGTYTNVDRRVQRVRPAVPAPGQAKSDLWTFQVLAKEMGVNLGGTSAKAVNEEIRGLVPLYAGISYARLDSPTTPAGLQWPCPSTDHPGTPVLYSDGFPGGKGRLIPAEYEERGGEAEPGFTLITGPTKFDSGSLAARSAGLARLQGETVVLVHPADARALGLEKDQRVRLESGNGKISAKVSLSTLTAPGVLFIPGHIGKNGGNQLTGWDLGITRVKLEKVEPDVQSHKSG